FENVGGGNFTPRILGQAFSYEDVIAADIDGDGGLDVLASSGTDRRIVWFKGLGGLYDFGDAPEAYGTRLADDGARPVAAGPRLGGARHGEADGAPAAGEDGDDLGYRDDEGGVGIPKLMQQGRRVTFPVVVQNAPAGARLDAWIDFNGDGDWSDPGEQI